MSGIARLKGRLVETGGIGRPGSVRVERCDQLSLDIGVTRPAGSKENRQIRDYAVRCMEEAGLRVAFDAVGNIFGRRDGSKPGLGSVMCGSHVDSVRNGGMFDGALGVFGAIEAVQRLKEENFENKRPLEVAIFTGEEASAFKQVLLGSSVLTGKVPLKQALDLRDEKGRTLQDALDGMGYRGTSIRSLDDVEFMIEMHIEQGPILYEEGTPIGIVQDITGLAWMLVTITGQENHAGTTPMNMRKDALVAASDVVTFVNKRANEMVEELGSSTVGTVGRLNVFPNGTNVVPGRVELGIDIRDVNREHMEDLIQEIVDFIENLEARYDVMTEIQMPAIHNPVPLSKEVTRVIEESAKKLEISSKRMSSGAGHDAQNIAEKIKTGMIFVPSVHGISHSPLEWTEWADVEKGLEVLVETLKSLSKE